MLKITIIDCKTKSLIIAFLFASAIFNKSFTANNISVFENLFICQMSLEKNNTYWSKLLIF